ncbi:MmpS family transport accessory protein [Pseudonocardia nantongensis]|uniref:MmpS family transport accessory protein n=1 Tax=Pseudonocardia nantongensis TaxID=1181885 RepID=UPI0039797B0C
MTTPYGPQGPQPQYPYNPQSQQPAPWVSGRHTAAGQPPHGQPAWIPAPPEPPRKKGGKWKWVVGVLAVLVVIGMVNGGGESPEDATAATPVAEEAVAPAPVAPPAPVVPAAPAPAPVAPAPVEEPAEPASTGITYEVTGKQGSGTGYGPGTSVTYTSGENMQLSQNTDTELPWTETVDLGDNMFRMATLTAQAGDGVTSITCRITENGEVLAENTSTGQFAVVSCNAS